MTTSAPAAIIMAAGKSTRMKSRLPKAAYRLCGRTIGRHIVEACRGAGVERIVVVVGHESEAVKAAIGDDVQYVTQAEQLGTGHAVRCAREALGSSSGPVVVLPGDTPLVSSQSIASMVSRCCEGGASATLLTALLDDAGMYGRIVRDESGAVRAIVEAKDASPEIISIREICSSIYTFRSGPLFESLEKITPENRQREYYLTDVIGILVAEGHSVDAHIVPDHTDVLGINTRVELAEAEAIMRDRIRRAHMLAGVTLMDPRSIYIDSDVTIGADTYIYPGSLIEGKTSIGEGCTIGPFSRIVSSNIADDVTVDNSTVFEASIGKGSIVGPYARIRPGTSLGERVHVGDFVEIKNSAVGDRVSLAHMTYIGDTDIGPDTNIGAGTITCNYDGKRKHHTHIGAGAFVGSHTTLNAPVSVGDGAFIASGSVITKDVPPDALAIARSQQIVKDQWARRRREKQQE